MFSILIPPVWEASCHCVSEPWSPKRPPVSCSLAAAAGHHKASMRTEHRCKSVTHGDPAGAHGCAVSVRPRPAVLLHTHAWDLTTRTKATEITAMSYSPRILRGRRHFEGPFQTVPLSHLSFQEICHKSDECPLIRAMGHCKNGWHAQCARRGVCCTVRNQQKHSHYKPCEQPGTHPSWTEEQVVIKFQNYAVNNWGSAPLKRWRC